MYKYVFTSILSFIVGCVTMFGCIQLLKNEKTVQAKSIVSNTISGNPLTIKNIITKSKETIIETKYNGTGESDIAVPNNAIPSANAWDNLHWVGSAFISTDKAVYVGGGYRYERFTGLGGVWFRNNSGDYDGGAWVGCMYIIK